jgi:hypothetical protein
MGPDARRWRVETSGTWYSRLGQPCIAAFYHRLTEGDDLDEGKDSTKY